MIKHEAKGRMRIHAVQNRMSYAQADTLLYFLHSQKEVTFAKVYDRTCDASTIFICECKGIFFTRNSQTFSQFILQYFFNSFLNGWLLVT